MSKSDRNGAAWQKYLLIALCVILSLTLIVLITVTVFVESALNRINRPSVDYTEPADTSGGVQSTEPDDTDPVDPDATIDPDYTGPILDPDDITFPTIAPDEPVIQGEEIINILLIGQDRRAGESTQRSDSMILCTFNTKKGTITMTSFLRDLYVDIPGRSANRLNAAYQFGGMRLLDEALAINFGVHVDANVEVDFFGFMKIIDILGGVDINLTAKEAAYLNKNGNWEVSPNSGVWNLKEGMNHLNADQALAYSRIRYLDSDFGRTNRQRTVLMALINAYKDQSMGTMLSLLYEILPLITTDMTNAEIVGYATRLFPMLSNSTITTQQIPASGAYKNAVVGRIGQVLIPDLIANRQLLQKTIME